MPNVPQCSFCKHYYLAEKAVENPKCLAFPEGIPDEIIENEYDHREPYQGDKGIQFEDCDVEMMQTRFSDWSAKMIAHEKGRTLFIMACAKPHR
jgi:hypothetical protein